MPVRATLGLVSGIGAIVVGSGAFSHRPVVQDPPAAEHHAHIRSAVGAELVQEMQRALGGQRSASTMVSTTAEDLLEALDYAMERCEVRRWISAGGSGSLQHKVTVSRDVSPSRGPIYW